MPVVERDLDEHQRLVRHRGMEERVAAAVGVEPVLQVVPRRDRVHGLVLDQLLEQRGRGVPRDAPQRRAGRRRTASSRCVFSSRSRSASDVVVGADAQHVGAQVDEELHAAVEAGEQAERVGRRAASARRAARSFRDTAVVAAAAARASRRRPRSGRSRTRGRACGRSCAARRRRA